MTAWLRMSIVALSFGLTTVAAAQESPEDWRWFEIEVLVFKHHANDDAEEFPWHPPRQFNAEHDLLSGYYAPNFFGMLYDIPQCPEQGESLKVRPVFCALSDEIDPFAQPWYQPHRILSGFKHSPATVINGLGGDITRAHGPFLQPTEAHLFNDFREQLERRNVGTPLLHLSYRAPVFTRRANQKLRLFGGENFGQEFLPSGYPQPPFATEDDNLTEADAPPRLFEELEALLGYVEQGQLQLSYRDHRTPNPPPLIADRDHLKRAQPVWELDGTLHIYLVGNYLHIDSDLELRVPQSVRFNQRELAAQLEQALQTERSTSKFLRSYRLNQLRRVISHETHYFDHPQIGLVVQIRRTDLSARR